MKPFSAVVLAALFVAPVFAADRPPACEDILQDESREKLQGREQDTLSAGSQAHQSLSAEPSVQRALSSQRDALYYFQRVREGLCQRKQKDAVHFQLESQAATRSAQVSGAHDCDWFQEQEGRYALASTKLAEYKKLLEKQRNEWRKHLESSYKFNREVIVQAAKEKRIAPQNLRGLNAEAQRLWIGSRGAKGKAIPGFFPGLTSFLLSEIHGVDAAIKEIHEHGLKLRASQKACGGMSSAAQMDPALTKIAEEEALRCRTPAKFIQKRTGLTEICGNRSKGKCYEATNATLIRAGYVRPGQLSGVGAIQAHTDGHLERAGFRNVISKGYTPTNAPEGAVLVYSSTHHSYGHIEVRTNGRNCSDYCLNGAPGPNYHLEGVYVRAKP